MWRVLARYLAFRKIGTVVVESLLLVLCILEAGRIRLGPSFTRSANYPWFVAKAFVMAFVFQMSLHFCDVYSFRQTASAAQFPSRLGGTPALASIGLVVTYYLFPDLTIGRGVFVISLVLVI